MLIIAEQMNHPVPRDGGGSSASATFQLKHIVVYPNVAKNCEIDF
jgi:hypothetical protein